MTTSPPRFLVLASKLLSGGASGLVKAPPMRRRSHPPPMRSGMGSVGNRRGCPSDLDEGSRRRGRRGGSPPSRRPRRRSDASLSSTGADEKPPTHIASSSTIQAPCVPSDPSKPAFVKRSHDSFNPQDGGRLGGPGLTRQVTYATTHDLLQLHNVSLVDTLEHRLLEVIDFTITRSEIGPTSVCETHPQDPLVEIVGLALDATQPLKLRDRLIRRLGLDEGPFRELQQMTFRAVTATRSVRCTGPSRFHSLDRSRPDAGESRIPAS